MRRKIIPYNPSLKNLTRQLRQHMTYAEVRRWNELKNGKMMGYDFDRKRPIDNFMVDFFCKDLVLALEVDGITHHDEKAVIKDEVRQEKLEALGVDFLRFNALDVVNDMPNTLRAIEHWIMTFEDKYGVDENVLRKRSIE